MGLVPCNQGFGDGGKGTVFYNSCLSLGSQPATEDCPTPASLDQPFKILKALDL